MSDLVLLNPEAGLLPPGGPLVPACYGPEAPHFPYLGSDVAFGQVSIFPCPPPPPPPTSAALGRSNPACRST